MSEQDRKRAEEVWSKLHAAFIGYGDKTWKSPVELLDAALAQARREGVEAMLNELVNTSSDIATVERLREIAARLLAKEEA